MRKLRTELYNLTRKNWDEGAGRQYIYAREAIASISSKRKTFHSENWRAVRRGLRSMASRGLRSASVKIYESYDAECSGKSRVLMGAEEIFVEMPNHTAVEEFYRLLVDKASSESLDTRSSSTKLSRYKAKHRVDFSWVSFQEQLQYRLNHEIASE